MAYVMGVLFDLRCTLLMSQEACEIQLNLESLKLDCQQEWIEVAGQRICGEQPLRQRE